MAVPRTDSSMRSSRYAAPDGVAPSMTWGEGEEQEGGLPLEGTRE
jgi:hypothetical protein